MIEFLTNNWQFVVCLLCGLFELILMLVAKKRPEVVDNSFLSKLSVWILEAEDKFQVGSDKLNYVLGRAKAYLGDMYVEKDCKALIEYLLTLPEKKGIK